MTSEKKVVCLQHATVLNNSTHDYGDKFFIASTLQVSIWSSFDHMPWTEMFASLDRESTPINLEASKQLPLKRIFRMAWIAVGNCGR